MKDKINVAELLKDCPKGMELYSPIYGNGILTKVTDRIHVKFPKEHNVKCFRPDGRVSEDGEIMIFPKGKTTWEGFVPPCKFKDGDVVTSVFQGVVQGTGIFGYEEQSEAWIHACINLNNEFSTDGYLGHIYNLRLAIEEEKQKLFDSIKENGYRWNPETKTLEKLIEPKFKVGDKVKDKNNFTYTVLSIKRWGYILNDIYRTCVTFGDQDKYELVPNKFDLNTLVPFESKVLVRGDKSSYWKPAIFGCYIKDMIIPYYALGGNCWHYCIPYEMNEHLLGTTNDCEEYFKTWE